VAHARLQLDWEAFRNLLNYLQNPSPSQMQIVNVPAKILASINRAREVIHAAPEERRMEGLFTMEYD